MPASIMRVLIAVFLLFAFSSAVSARFSRRAFTGVKFAVIATPTPSPCVPSGGATQFVETGQSVTATFVDCVDDCPSFTLADVVQSGNVQATSAVTNGCITTVSAIITGKKREVQNGQICIPALNACTDFITTGVGAGDPHFVGINGQRFDFDGEVGSVYNLLSDSNVEVNSLFGSYNDFLNLDLGTWMVEIGVQTDNNKVLVRSGSGWRNDAPSLEINEKDIDMSVAGNFTAPDFVVAWKTVDADAVALGNVFAGHAIRSIEFDIGTTYRFRVLCIEDGKKDGKWVAIPHRYLDIQVQLLQSFRRPHGILGQTAGQSFDFTLEGEEEDYVVASGDIFGNDFKYNKFH